jgi:recombination protein RecA
VSFWSSCSSGFKVLDHIMGGGIPIGRIVEFFGDFSSGKSTLATHFMIQFQKVGGIIFLIDTETGWDKRRAIKMGLDPSNNFYVLDALTVEEGFSLIDNIFDNIPLTNKLPILIVWDTISACPTFYQKEKDDANGGGMTSIPRAVRDGLRKITMEIPRHNASVLFVNQTQESIGMYAGPNDTNIGHGVKFHSSIRLQLRSRGKFVENDVPIGITTAITCVKNKLNKPQGKVDMAMYYDTGINDLLTTIQFLTKVGVISTKGGGYSTCESFNKEMSGARIGSKDGLNKWLTDNPGLLEHLYSKVDEKKDSLWMDLK